MEYREDNNYPKAFAATTFILAAIFALTYFIVFTAPPRQEDGTGGILVNYGTTDEGMGADFTSVEEPSQAEKANKSKPDKVTPTPPTNNATAESSDKKVVTQNTEDAPVVADKAKNPSNTVATQADKPAAKPTINQNALYKGKKNDGTGQGDGTGNTPGNQGKSTGSTLTDNYDGTGSGNGGNLNLTQRSFIVKPTVDDATRRVGKIVVDIQVDKNGKVISATAGARGTTISDDNLFRKCEQSALASKVNASSTAPDVQVGTIVFVFRVQ